ncbi:MAG: hypothetical protein FD146_1472 [Anaerolineaceae bacterium]|nr:MAG: hypothetical protein FD146_1472 [Anaerolineaceae bacterium]
MEEKRGSYLGTYFSKETTLRLVSIAKIFSWVVVGIYSCQWLVQFVQMILSIVRGFWYGMGYTDIALSFVMLFEQPLRGAVYFIVLQVVAQALLLFMDMEDNTRRAARSAEQGGASSSLNANLPRP